MMLLAVIAICAVIFSVNDAAPEHVGFSAVVSDDKNYAIGDIVIFDNGYVNFGTTYNTNTGIFTASMTGLYVFHIHGLSSPNTGFWFTIYRNDEPLYRAHGQVTQGYTSAGNSIALSVKSGERVYVIVHYPSSIHGSGLNRYATFTGYLVDVGTGNVGFSAVVSEHMSYHTDDIVKFDNIYVNYGNAYNNNTGIFTAPRTGLYVFHLHGQSIPNTGFWFTIYRNDESLYRAHGLVTQGYSSGGNSIALRVNSGERVYVKAYYPSSVLGSGLNRYTTFTGYLVATAGNVAFSAVVNDDRNYQTNDIVKFDNVFVNYGNAYNSDTGIFTTPKTGLYVFHLHGLSLPNTGFWFTIYRNDEPLSRAHGRVEQGNSYGGNSIALRVHSGERVYVKVHYPSSIHGSGLNRYATFTGYLVDVGTSEQTTSGEACQQ